MRDVVHRGSLCKASEEPGHCAARAADLALSFRKMGQGKAGSKIERGESVIG